MRRRRTDRRVHERVGMLDVSREVVLQRLEGAGLMGWYGTPDIEKIQKLRDKRCWFFAYGCPCRTAVCYGLPDDGCPVYRWFKELIELRGETNDPC